MKIQTKDDLLDFIIDQKLNTKQVQKLLQASETHVIFLDDNLTPEQIANELEKFFSIPAGYERPLFLPMDMDFDIKRDYSKVINFKD